MSADDLARYQQKPSSQGSYHVVIDKHGRIVRENDDAFIPWAAGTTGNRIALHVCAIGYASWTRAQWLARPKQLDSLRRWLNHAGGAYSIPLHRLTVADTRARRRGVTGHNEISKAWGEVNHWDPGEGLWAALALGGDAAPTVHVVAPGDNLSIIAERYGVTVGKLVELNALRMPNLIHPGQKIRVR